MAIDKTVARASGKVTLVANTTYSVKFTGTSKYLDLLSGIDDIVYFTVFPGLAGAALDETAVTPTNAETFAVPPKGRTYVPALSGGDDFVVNIECATAGDVVVQLVDL